ncbi:unnamed protein product [Owenia fusiformis]|uniref:Uncharacterized protein n=1 Tax=Owenia fusiformis TaxID=6347 RepID=A0A8J1XXA6_OWEFU|nr:unnamed protein product [Owenia fusiformis]
MICMSRSTALRWIVIFCGACTLHMFLQVQDIPIETDFDILEMSVSQLSVDTMEIPPTYDSDNKTKEYPPRNVNKESLEQNETDSLPYVKQNEHLNNYMYIYIPSGNLPSNEASVKRGEISQLQYMKQNRYLYNRLNSSQQREYHHLLSLKQNEYNRNNGKNARYYRFINTLSSNKIVDNSEVSLSRGWWFIKEEYWTKYTDCSNLRCYMAFAVQCLSKVRALYQYIPIRQTAPIKGLYFSVNSFNKILMKQDNPFGHQYTAMALLKFTDGSNHTIQLQFSPQEGHQQQSDVYMLPKDTAPLLSISLSLACAGFKGPVAFMDIIISPIVEEATMQNDPKLNDFIATCPEQAPLPNIEKFRFRRLTLNHHIISIANDITLVTQVSADRLYMLNDVLPYWDGPVSIAIYIPASESLSDKQIYDDNYLIRKLKTLTQRCEITILYGAYYMEKYPINTLRNHAMRRVQTEYLLLTDADFLPSINFQRHAKLEIIRLKNILNQADTDNTYTTNLDKTAFVAPAFEYLKNPFKSNNLAKSKVELRKLYNTQSGIRIFNGERSDNHKATNYEKWFKTSHSYEVTDYQIKYEPYVVLRKHNQLPLYDERFVGYGMNKVSYLMELKAAGYTFVVLPNCWVSHIPHEKTDTGLAFSYDVFARLRNRVLRYEFMGDYTRKYEIGGCSESKQRDI